MRRMKRAFHYVLLALLSISAFSVSSVAHASTSDNISGWAWSSSIGWISFNCTNDSSCGTSDYGVTKNPDGTLTGYAWSSSLGWIQFGGLSGFPTGTGTYSQNAQVVGTTVRGWAQATALGSDGWISFTGSSPTYGVNLNGVTFDGYAWGNDPAGWISFNCTNDSSCGTVSYSVQMSGDASLDVQSGSVSIVGNNAVPYATTPTFIWTLTNIPSASCSVSKTSTGGTAFSTVSGITSSGSVVGSALTQSATTTYTYSIDCTNPTISKQVSFTALPQPPGFSIGGTEGVRIQILSAGAAESEQNNTFVTATGGYSNTVGVFISTFPSAPASTTFTYSLNGGASYSANPGTVNIASPYTTGVPFKMKVTRLNGAPDITSPITVTLTGAGTGAPNATKDIIVTPVNFNPIYEEY